MSIAIQNLHFTYESKPLLQGVNLFIKPGEIVTLIGASGSGKTTLLQALSGLVTPDAGSISINGSISYMTQDHRLLPWRTVLENIELPSELGKREKKSGHLLAEELGLGEFKNHYPRDLSGGMKQRVALGRALLEERPILTLDEPFTGLDVALKEELYAYLRSKKGLTLLLVTHDFHDALALSDRIVFLKKGLIHKEWKKPFSPTILEQLRSSLQES